MEKNTRHGPAPSTRARHEALADRIARREALEGVEAAMRDIDSDFHSALVDALRNPMIAETHRALTENIKLARVLNNEMASPSRLREALAEHLRVLDAVGQNDYKAAREALETHFSQSIHRVFS